MEKNILTLENVNDYKLVSKKDQNGRDIKLFTFNNVFFTGTSQYYPDILFKIENQNDLVLPIKEMSMSMNKKSYYEENGLKYIEKSNNEEYIQIDHDVYYFIYNTENYYHFIYDTLPYLYLYLQMKDKNNNLKLVINYNKNKNKLLNFIKETYEILNINNDDIIIHNKKINTKKFIYQIHLHMMDYQIFLLEKKSMKFMIF